MFLILLHVEKKKKNTKDKTKRNQKQADKMVKENILVQLQETHVYTKIYFL